MSDHIKDLISFAFEWVIIPMALGIGGYFSGKIRTRLQNRQKPYSLRISSEKNERIQELLTEIRVSFEANRAYLSMFHNGDRYIDGSDILKKSRINECVDASTNFQAQYFQEIKIGLLPDEMKLIREPGPSFTLVKDLKDGKFKRLLISGGVKAVARCAIKNGDNIVGFIGLDFIKSDIQPLNIDELVTYSGILEQVLSSFKNKK